VDPSSLLNTSSFPLLYNPEIGKQTPKKHFLAPDFWKIGSGDRHDEAWRGEARAWTVELPIGRGKGDLAPKNESRLNVRIFGLGRRQRMARKRFTAEQIIIKLREAEVVLAQGQTVGQVSKQIGVTEQT
jgi:hypothetical protein